MGHTRTEEWMRHALVQARRGWGETHPNPMVGAVIVESSHVAAMGYHRRAGAPHAEVEVIRDLMRPAQPGSVLYVTLEPCSTIGRTGPCCEAIIKSGLKQVVVGALDPNPAHSGRGLDILRKAGIAVQSGVLDAECRDLNIIFNHWITRQTPLLAAKVATTLDGYIATRSGQSKWITGHDARQDVMHWRRLFPAIAVGAGTVLIDDPSLTVRGGHELCPVRFIFDRRMRSLIAKPVRKVYNDAFREKTIIVAGPRAPASRLALARKLGIRVWQIDEGETARFIDAFRLRCASEAICGVYIEGGSRLLSALLQAGQLDYLFAYRAPMLLADRKAVPVFQGAAVPELSRGLRLGDVRCHCFDNGDQMMRGFIAYSGRSNPQP